LTIPERIDEPRWFGFVEITLLPNADKNGAKVGRNGKNQESNLTKPESPVEGFSLQPGKHGKSGARLETCVS
jgi:hypothetical protein